MQTSDKVLMNDLLTITGDLEASGKDLYDLYKLVDNPQLIDMKIRGLKNAMSIIHYFMDDIAKVVVPGRALENNFQFKV